MMQSEEEENIIVKFKRHGQPINRKSLERTMAWLRQSPSHSLDVLLRKLNQLALQHNNHEENLQHALEILSLKNSNLSSYEELLEETRKRCIYPISPYEYSIDTWFAERPQPELFRFRPEDKLKNAQVNYKRIAEANKEIGKEGMLGVIYESYSSLQEGSRPRFIMQNEVNEAQLNMSIDFVPDCLVLPGASYIAKGHYEGKDLSLTVSSMSLPNGPQQEKQSMLKQKFKQMCQNISAGKESLGFQIGDFLKYDCVYTPSSEQLRPTLLFGNVTLNTSTAKRLQRLVQAYPRGVGCVVLLLSSEQHEEDLNLQIWLRCKVYLVPHLASEGPRLLPKLPLLKTHLPGAKILTNPARLCIEGKQLVIVNYPLIRNIFSQCILPRDMQIIKPELLPAKACDLLFSQGSVSLAQDIYWPQSNYFLVNQDTIVVVSDSVSAMGWHKSKGKGGMATSGNFQRDGDFLCLMSRSKNLIQFCQEPTE